MPCLLFPFLNPLCLKLFLADHVLHASKISTAKLNRRIRELETSFSYGTFFSGAFFWLSFFANATLGITFFLFFSLPLLVWQKHYERVQAFHFCSETGDTPRKTITHTRMTTQHPRMAIRQPKKGGNSHKKIKFREKEKVTTDLFSCDILITQCLCLFCDASFVFCLLIQFWPE